MRFCRVVRVDRGAGNDGALRHFGSEARLILGCTPQSRPFRFPDLTQSARFAQHRNTLDGLTATTDSRKRGGAPRRIRHKIREQIDDSGPILGRALGHFGAPDSALIAFGQLLRLHDLGEGFDEVLPSFGDSGGPTFLHGAIAGLHSFSFRVGSSDIDGILNQSFGEFGADVRISAYANWIDAETAVPEPSCLFPAGFALFTLMARRRLAR